MASFAQIMVSSNSLHYFVASLAIWLLLAFYDVNTVVWSPFIAIGFLIIALLAFWQHYERLAMIGMAGIVAVLLLIIDLDTPLEADLFDGQSLRQVKAKIISIPKRTRYGSHFEIKTQSIDSRPMSLRLTVSLNQKWQSPHLGDIWSFQGKLKPVIGLHNGIDEFKEKQAFIRYQRGHLTVGSRHEALRLSTASSWLDHIRLSFLEKLKRGTEGMTHQGILASLLLADQTSLNYQDKSTFKKTGTSHLLAISGMHLGAVGGFFWFLSGFVLRAVLRSQSLVIRHYQSLIVMTGLTFYVALTGFALPTIRAELMALWLAVALWLRLKPSAWDALSFAALSVLLVSPRQVLAVSFQLSFLAVLMLLVIGAMIKDHRPAIQWLKQSFVFSLVSMPLNALLFHAISPVAWIANVVAVPVVTLWVLPLGLLGLVLSWLFPLLSSGAFALANQGMNLLLIYLKFMQELPVAYIPLNISDSSLWLFLSFVLLSLFYSHKRLLASIVVLVMAWPLIMAHPDPPEAGQFRVHVLDVGQGLAILVETKHHRLLYDTGPSRGAQGNTGKNVVVPYLLKKGISHLDMVVISHGDDDHQGGFLALQQQISFNQLLLGEPDRAPGVHFDPCLRGHHWDWDGVGFTILHPDANTSGKNNRSCIIKINNTHHAILLPGDAEKKIEKQLVTRYGSDLAADILVAGHHGSKTSNSVDFLDFVAPDYFVISSAFLNQYRFPHQEVVQRLHGVQQMNTANQGLIRMEVGEKIDIFSQAQSRKSHWNHYYRGT